MPTTEQLNERYEKRLAANWTQEGAKKTDRQKVQAACTKMLNRMYSNPPGDYRGRLMLPELPPFAGLGVIPKGTKLTDIFPDGLVAPCK